MNKELQAELFSSAKERYDDLLSNLDYVFTACHAGADDNARRKNLFDTDLYLQAVMLMAVLEDALDPEEVDFINNIGDYGKLFSFLGIKPVRANYKAMLATAGKLVGAPPEVFLHVSGLPSELYGNYDVCAMISEALVFVITCCCKIDGVASRAELSMTSRLLAPLFAIMKKK